MIDVEDMLRDTNPSVTLQALDLILTMSEPDRLDYLAQAVASHNALVGDRAASALAEYGKEGAERLLAALNETTIIVKIHIIKHLADLHYVEAVEPLMDILQSADSATLRYTVIHALGKLGDKRVIPILEQFIDDENHHVRKYTIQALSALQDRK